VRVLHVSTRLIVGGSQENTLLSCIGQADLGHAVGLAYGPIYGPEGSLLDAARGDGRIELIEIPHLVRDLAPSADLRAYRQLRATIRSWAPDVVHTHSSKAGILGRFAARHEGVPAVVHTIHGLAFDEFQPRWRNALYVRAERAAARRCDAIACVSAAMRDRALAAGIGRPDQYSVVYSGIDVAPYRSDDGSRHVSRERLGFEPHDYVVGTIARLSEGKGHDDLIDVLGKLAEDEPRLRFLWIGDGWMRSQLERRISAAGLSARVTMTGMVPPSAIPALLRAVDALVHPSYREGLPRAVTQALLSRLPVVAYDVGGTREVCVDGETGRLVPPGDVPALTDAVRWVLANPEGRERMAEAGHALCMRRFPVERMVEALENLYATAARRGEVVT
jgi:glycosyltransferase involved in cell wall biosynthesis